MKPITTPIYPRPTPHKGIRVLENKNNILNNSGFGFGYEAPPTQAPPTSQHPSSLNCVTIANHIETCPVCSKLYDTDKTLYILAIIILLILYILIVRYTCKITVT
jgi:hypothetical protein